MPIEFYKGGGVLKIRFSTKSITSHNKEVVLGLADYDAGQTFTFSILSVTPLEQFGTIIDIDYDAGQTLIYYNIS